MLIVPHFATFLKLCRVLHKVMHHVIRPVVCVSNHQVSLPVILTSLYTALASIPLFSWPVWFGSLCVDWRRMSAVNSGYAAMRFGRRWTVRLSISFEGALAPIDNHLLSRAADDLSLFRAVQEDFTRRLVLVNVSKLWFALT